MPGGPLKQPYPGAAISRLFWSSTPCGREPPAGRARQSADFHGAIREAAVVRRSRVRDCRPYATQHGREKTDVRTQGATTRLRLVARRQVVKTAVKERRRQHALEGRRAQSRRNDRRMGNAALEQS